MKKSVLWAAAGVVTATAIWAAISLPPQTTTRQVTHLGTTPKPLSNLRRTTIVTITNEEGTSIDLCNLAEPSQIQWTGRFLTLTPSGAHIMTNHTGSATTLMITRRRSEMGPHFYCQSTTSFTRTLRSGETIQL